MCLLFLLWFDLVWDWTGLRANMESYNIYQCRNWMQFISNILGFVSDLSGSFISHFCLQLQQLYECLSIEPTTYPFAFTISYCTGRPHSIHPRQAGSHCPTWHLLLRISYTVFYSLSLTSRIVPDLAQHNCLRMMRPIITFLGVSTTISCSQQLLLLWLRSEVLAEIGGGCAETLPVHVELHCPHVAA